ncbi:MAG: MBL fold metallo-hydrolase [Chloroflexota bacterium]
MKKEVQQFQTSDGRSIYNFQTNAFPNLISNIYIIDDGNQLILVDTGSGFRDANKELVEGFTAVAEFSGQAISLENIGHIIITHGHIDHFGGLPFVREHTDAPVGIHILDRRVITTHEERAIFASSRLEAFLETAGITAEHRQSLMEVYKFGKMYYKSQPIDFLLEEEKPTVGGVEVYHVPGHCPGQVCLKIDDIMLTADHVLSKTTPHQAPESITNNTGLGHYLDSLTKIERVPGIRLGLGGHEAPMTDLYCRIQDIKASHEKRLNKIIDICAEPQSIAEISKSLFGQVESYHVLLALEEAGAHVEYLYQRGELLAANLDEIEQNSHPVVKYRRS